MYDDEHYTNVEEQEQEHKIRDFFNDNFESIVKIAFSLLLIVGMFGVCYNLLEYISVSEIKEEYATAVIVGYDEDVYRYRTHYFVYFDIDGTEIKTENAKIYMSSEIGDVYKIKLIGEFNKNGNLLSYDFRFIEKLESGVVK